MAVRAQPWRQIHLDFHTSEHLEIARDFNAQRFGETLEQARVQSIQLFARDWHGWMYYPSARFPDHVHPLLNGRNLLGEQIQACHERGIATPIYVAAQVDRQNSYRHPEWVMVTPDGKRGDKGVFEPQLGPGLCLNTPYGEWLAAHIDEILETVPVDGFWFDGVGPQDCSCRHCQEAMLQRGLDPSDKEARRAFGFQVAQRFCNQTSTRIREKFPDATLFYNAGHIGPRHRLWRDSHTHFEIESLPGGGWGYLHFPVAVRQARTFGREIVGMTGKFHTTWGDFHSFKNLAALEFECFQMLAQGAKCSVGDQLHPNAVLDPHTYELIGQVFRQIEEVQSWCEDAQPVVEIGLLTSEGLLQKDWDTLLPNSILGATRMLQELALQFDILEIATGQADFSGYKLLILPDDIAVDDDLAGHLTAYLERGGAILSSGHSGLRPDGSDFALSQWGVRRIEDIVDEDVQPYSPDFLVPQKDWANELPRTEHVMYQGAIGIEAQPDGEVLARRVLPPFNRTWKHFCSHLHAPTSGRDGGAAIVRNGQVIQFAHPMFTIYRERAPRWCKTLVKAAVLDLLGTPLLRHDGPSTLLATINDQAAQDRAVVHLLHYVPERRTPNLDIVEDRLPLHGLNLQVKSAYRVLDVALEPQGTSLEFAQNDGILSFCVPLVDGHQLVVLKRESSH